MKENKLELLIPPPVIALLTAIMVYVVNRLLPAGLHLPGDRWLGFVFVVVGFALALAGAVQFKRASTTIHPQNPEHTSSLVTHGVYRLSRNPMYLGMLLVLFGWVLYLGNLVSAVCLLLFILYINQFQIVPEERIIKNKFGAEFEQYCSRVRRWL